MLEGYKVFKTEEDQGRTSEVIYSNFHEVQKSASHRLTEKKAEELERTMIFLVSQWEHDHKLAELFKQTVDDSSTNLNGRR
jgi:hypothetical protein